MAYLQHTSWKDRPGAVAAVIAIHAGIGFVLVNGLTFVKEIVVDPPLIGETIVPDIPLDPPPPADKQETYPDRSPVAPLPPVELSDRTPPFETTPIVLPPIPIQPRIIPTPSPPVDIGPRKPAFDPIAAKPRNDPSAWVTTSDYRSSWINREWTGIARVSLSVSAAGRVENCAITASSGHPELDAATCDLITRRARFDPARDGDGDKTSGSFNTAVRWELPR